ncbi:MAG: hypothetical protein AMXMBFR64_18370 [Myxococcales bacterium]
MIDELACDLVFERLWVGRYPHSPEHVDALQRMGVSAVLNLQSDEDLLDRGVSWPALWGLYTARGITVERVPILDFSRRDLQKHLTAAVDRLQALHRQGRTVYLHCNAGLNRSPTVAIAWLVAHQGLEPAAAHAHVEERHHCIPYLDVVERWRKKGR